MPTVTTAATAKSARTPAKAAHPYYEIESELLPGVVRRVRDTQATRKIRRFAWNGFLAAFCLAYLWASNQAAPYPLLSFATSSTTATDIAGASQRDVLNTLLLGGAVVGLACLLRMEGWYAYRRRLLREGIVGVGTVVSRRKDHDLKCFLSYEFGLDGYQYKIYPNEVAVSAEQYDRHPQGAPLTILYLGHRWYTCEPYIGIREAQIEGAARRESETTE